VRLDEEQIERYSRQIILPGIGGKGQEKLLAARVLVVGAGGLGSPAGLYLAAAGVGTIGVIDSDEVDRSNLQRQIFHSTFDLGRPKVDSAAERMEAINPGVSVRRHRERLTPANATGLFEEYDFVIDGTDTFQSKFLICDACHLARKPYSHAGILRFEGQTITVIPGDTTCYRCIFRAPPPPGSAPSCAQAGVLGAVAGVIGTIQATEALKYVLGIGDLLTGRLLVYDALEMKFRLISVNRSRECPLCGDNPTVTKLVDEERFGCDPRSDLAG